MSTSRLEKFIYAICSMEVADLPAPLSRIETLWNCLINDEVPDFEPQSRNEKYLMAMLDRYDINDLPTPMSRGEKLLYKIAVGDTDLSDIPDFLSRYEELLKCVIENGGIKGEDFEYVLHTLNKPLSVLYSTAEAPVKSATVYGETMVNVIQGSSKTAVTPMGEPIKATSTTITGTVNGAIKGAVLEGQTLLNIVSSNKFGGDKLLYEYCFDNNPVFSGNKMTVFVVNTNIKYIKVGLYHESTDVWSHEQTFDVSTDKKIVFEAPTNMKVKYVGVIVREAGVSTGYENGLVVMHGDQSNLEIDNYFEGMKSVRRPVLKTSNQNNILEKCHISLNQAYGAYIEKITDTTGKFRLTNASQDVRITPIGVNTIIGRDKWACVTIRFGEDVSNVDFGSSIEWVRLKDNRTFLYKSQAYGGNNIQGMLAKSNRGFTLNQLYTFKVISIIPISSKWTFDEFISFKSNTLSTPEKLNLYSLPNGAKDTLNSETGELTQNIIEIVLNGDRDWRQVSSLGELKTYRMSRTFRVGIGDYSFPTDIICDNLPVVAPAYAWAIRNNPTKAPIVISRSTEAVGGIDIMVDADKMPSITNLATFKQYLNDNPVTIQCELAKPITKKINLSIVDQDGNKVPHLQAFDEATHISTSSEGLAPNVVIPADISYPSIIKPDTLYTVKLKYTVRTLLDKDNLELGNLSGTTGVTLGGFTDYYRPKNFIDVNPSFRYVIRIDKPKATNNMIEKIICYTSDNAFISNIPVKSKEKTITLPSNCKKIKFVLILTPNLIPNTIVDEYGVIVKKTTDRDPLINIGGAGRIITHDCFTIQTNKTLSFQEVRFTGKGFVVSEVTVVEGDQTTKDYGYFEGMQSIKGFGVKTVGKNLFMMGRAEYNVNDIHVKNENGNIVFGGSTRGYSKFDLFTGEFIGDHLAPITKYYKNKILYKATGVFILSAKLGKQQNVNLGSSLLFSVHIVFDDEKEVNVSYSVSNGNQITITRKFTVNSHINGIYITRWYGGSCEGLYIEQPQLENGSTVTSYELPKLNILTVNEDLVSRKVTDTYHGISVDELDLISGNHIQKVGEFKPDRTMLRHHDTNNTCHRFRLYWSNIPNIKRDGNRTKVLCNILNRVYSEGLIGIFSHGLSSMFLLNVDINIAPTYEDAIKWLFDNNVTILYELAEPITKPVDLTILDQDGQPTKLSTFDDITQVFIDSENLIPTVDLEAPTKIEETLSTMGPKLDDILVTQQLLEESADEQSKNTDTIMLATTDIYEEIL